jgi:hypothetical protein
MKLFSKRPGQASVIAAICLVGIPLLSWGANPDPKVKMPPAAQGPLVIITKPDLTLEQIQIERAGGDGRETFLKVTVAVRNKENGEHSKSAERTPVLLEWQGREGNKSWETWLPPLKVGERVEAVFPDCRIPAGQKGTFKAAVDPRNQVEEWNEANNSGSLVYEDKP